MKRLTPVGLLCVLGLAHCAGTVDGQASVPAEVAGSSQPPASEDTRDDRVEIAGRLLAHDGTPLRRAEVTVRRVGFTDAMATGEVDAEGRFGVSVPPGGVYLITVAAVDHRMVVRRTLVTDELSVQGRLGTYARTEPGESLGIRSEYLDAEGKVLGPGPASAGRVASDRYRLELPEKPAGATRLRYQLAVPGGRTFNGPRADEYLSDGGGDYWSLVDISDMNALELELGTLPPAGRPPQLRWTGESAPTATLLEHQERWSSALEDWRNRAPRKDGKIIEMTEALRAELSGLAAKAGDEVAATTDPYTQGLLRAAHLALFRSSFVEREDAPTVRAELVWVLEHVSPADPHLGLLFNFESVPWRARRDADDALVEKIEAWLDRQARENPEPSVALNALSSLLSTAEQRGEAARAKELYAEVASDRFDGAFRQLYLKQRFDPNRILKRGNPFPAFDFAGLRDDEPRVTSTDRNGKFYLIEFWATWCAPCVAEMPKLHAAYASINGAKPGKGKGKGDKGLRKLRPAKRPRVEFVFVSLDVEPANVEAFRKEHWSMPWTHGFAGRANEDEMFKRYGFSAVPTAVLMDDTGVILELGGPLRGDKLLPTLEQALRDATQ